MTTIARGLFRLWLVVSVLWIGLIGVATWPTISDELWQPPFYPGKPYEVVPDWARDKPWEAYQALAVC